MPEKCTFCRLAKGEIEFPGTFWEDEHHISFLSGHPNTLGFSVVIPKKHFGSDVLLMPDEDLSQLLIATKKVSSILVNFFDDVGRVGTITEGLGIDHAHVKIFLMY